VERRAFDCAVAAGGQANAALEPPLRKFEAMDDGGAHFRRKGSDAGEDDVASLDKGFNLVEIDPRQGGQDQDGAVGLQNIDGRLPGDIGGGADRSEKLSMHSLGPREHFEGLGPHPIAREIRLHRITLQGQIRGAEIRSR